MTKGEAEPGAGIAAAELVLLGRVAGAHGIKGEVRINSFTGLPEHVAAYAPLTDGKGRRFIIERLHSLKGTAVAALFAGISDRTAAEALKGVALYVERAKLPEPDAEEWYYTDLIGLAAITPLGETLGEVVAVQNFGAGDLLEIKPADGRPTLLVPFLKEVVPAVDVKAKRVVIDLPEDEDERP
jgi:16S rRNA processing protein RimM